MRAASGGVRRAGGTPVYAPAVEDALTFVRPDGVTVAVPTARAREIADMLWDRGSAPGAAARIVEALRSRTPQRRVEFVEREAVAMRHILGDALDWQGAT